jgi:hypothetical protein
MTPRLVVVGSYGLLADAHIAQHALKANGIESVIQHEYLHDEAAPPIQVRVAVGDAARARSILEPLASGFRHQVNAARGLLCPECGERSSQVTWTPPLAVLERFATLFTHHDLSRAEIQCNACGHSWSVPW